MTDLVTIRTKRSAPLLIATACAALGSPVVAQQSTPVPAAASAVGTGDIVVTAQKRSERLQDATVAVTALSSDAISRFSVTKLEDLVRTVPSLNITSFGGSEGYISLRGLSTGYGLAPAVSTYVDDVSYDFRSDAFTGSSIVEPFDLERIEVLRGPQGTVLGSSSLGGAIRLVTARPDPTKVVIRADTSIATTRGGDASYSARGALNLPLASNLAIRLVATYRHDGGWIDRSGGTDFTTIVPSAITASNENDTSSVMVRGALQWQPTDGLTITPYFLYQDTKQAGTAVFDPDAGRYVRQHLFLDHSEFQLATGALRIEKEIGGATLISATSYTRKKTRAINDFTGFGQGLSIVSGTGFIYAPLTFDLPVSYRQFTQEFRLVSNNTGPLRWIVGAYYNHQTQSNEEFFRGQSYEVLFGVSPLLEYSAPTRDEQYAAYGEATFAPGGGFEVTGGLRIYKLRQRQQTVQSGLLAGASSGPSNSSEAGVNPRVTLAYKPTRDINVYGTYARGFRPGGPNIGLNNVPPCSFIEAFKPSYGSDSVDNLEGGVKLQLADRHITLNAAAYRENWKEIQGAVNSSCGIFIANFGSARIDGVELETDVRLSENIRFGGTLSFNDAKLRRIAAPLLTSGIGTAGQRIIDVPRWQYGLNASLQLPIGQDRLLFLEPSWQHIGSAPTSYTGTPTSRPAYDNVDLRAGLRFGKFEVAAFVRNLTDELQVVSASRTVFVDTLQYSAARPRTIGLTLSMNTR